MIVVSVCVVNDTVVSVVTEVTVLVEVAVISVWLVVSLAVVDVSVFVLDVAEDIVADMVVLVVCVFVVRVLVLGRATLQNERRSSEHGESFQSIAWDFLDRVIVEIQNLSWTTFNFRPSKPLGSPGFQSSSVNSVNSLPSVHSHISIT